MFKPKMNCEAYIVFYRAGNLELYPNNIDTAFLRNIFAFLPKNHIWVHDKPNFLTIKRKGDMVYYAYFTPLDGKRGDMVGFMVGLNNVLIDDIFVLSAFMACKLLDALHSNQIARYDSYGQYYHTLDSSKYPVEFLSLEACKLLRIEFNLRFQDCHTVLGPPDYTRQPETALMYLDGIGVIKYINGSSHEALPVNRSIEAGNTVIVALPVRPSTILAYENSDLRYIIKQYQGTVETLKKRLSATDIDEYDTTNTKITYSLNNTETPLLILCGPADSGKTLTLRRLTRYLAGLGYLIEPRMDFASSQDMVYQTLAHSFDEHMMGDCIPPANIRMQLATVYTARYEHKLQILDTGPCDMTMTSDSGKRPLGQISNLATARMRKTWCFFIDPYPNEFTSIYTEHINRMRFLINTRRDKVILLFSKVDTRPSLMRRGRSEPDIKAAMRLARDMYPGLFCIFNHIRPLVRLWRPHTLPVTFLPFSSGSLSTDEEQPRLSDSPDRYPEALLKAVGGFSPQKQKSRKKR